MPACLQKQVQLAAYLRYCTDCAAWTPPQQRAATADAYRREVPSTLQVSTLHAPRGARSTAPRGLQRRHAS